MEKIKTLYEKYKVNFNEQFKKDLLEAAVNIYGEGCRQEFEQKINNVQMHTKFSVEGLKEYVQNHRGEEDFSLEEVIEEYEKEQAVIQEESKKEILERQYKLIDEIKHLISPEEAEKLDDEVEKLVLYKNGPIEFSEENLKFSELFSSLSGPALDLTVLKKVTKQYHLDAKFSERGNIEGFVKSYFDDLTQIDRNAKNKINEKYTSYRIINEECKDYDIDIDLLDEFNIPGSMTTVFASKEDINDIKSHIFMKPFNSDSKNLGVIAHEILHWLEKTIIVNEGDKTIETKTGFDDKIEGVDTTLLSECIHTEILDCRIYPYLRKLGYEISDRNDYQAKSLATNNEFFNKFETAILEARRGDINVLLDIVGKENFIQYAELQNRYYDSDSSQKAKNLLKSMEEYSRENLGTRIGKATLSKQEDVRGKQTVQNDINYLINYQTKDKGIEVSE